MESDAAARPGDALSPDDLRAIEKVGQKLRRAKRVLAVTGAGISADSGLPTYRGVNGLYQDDRLTQHGFTIEQALSGEMLRLRPDVTWHCLLEIERATRGVKPNRAHEILARMDGCFEAVWVLTQNIDGLHQAAGSRNVLDIHGDIHELQCTRCDYRERVADYSGLDEVPRCPKCDAVVRPAVVLFGEMLPQDAMRRLFEEMRLGFDVVFSIGTSNLFEYVAAPVYAAKDEGRTTVEINPDQTVLSDVVDYKIAARAAVAMDRIWEGHLDWWPHT